MTESERAADENRAVLDYALDAAMRWQRAYFSVESPGEWATLTAWFACARNAATLREQAVAWEMAAGAVHALPEIPAAFGSACAAAARMARIDRHEWRRLAKNAAQHIGQEAGA